MITDHFLWKSVMVPDMFQEQPGNSGGIQGGDCGYGMNPLDRQSTTTRVALYPLESRSSLIMSTEITCQCWSGTLLGISFPTFCVRKVFVQCRRDNGPMCKSPISTGFGPQNITVIMSQESHYWNAFLIGFTKTHFLHPPNYGYWDVSYIVGKVWMRRLQRRWNRRKRFRSGGEILETSLASVDLRGGIDSRSLSRPLGGLNCDVQLPEMLP